MHLTIRYDDENFSYLIYKHPDNVFERKVNALFDVKGYFSDGYKKYYTIETIPNYENFIKLCRDKNLDSYLIPEHHIISPFNIEAINIVFRSAIRNRNQAGEEKEVEPKYVTIRVYPVLIYNKDKFVNLFSSYFDNVTITPSNIENSRFIASVYLATIDKLSIVLQKLYVLFYVYTSDSRYNISLPNKEKLNKYIKFTERWLNEDDEFYNYITAKLGKNLYGKSFLRNNNKIQINQVKRLGDLRYSKIVELLPENSRVLDLGCGSGRLVDFIFKHKKRINKYYGIDCKPYNIDKANTKYKNRLKGKFSFYVGNILYPDEFWFKNVDVVVVSDVLEHLDEIDRLKLLKFLSCLNKEIYITVPNYDVNKIYWPDMESNYRHPDHKIEYSYEQFNNEIINAFNGRRYEKVCISDSLLCFKDQITYMLRVLSIDK